jgi:hypothetical protein
MEPCMRVDVARIRGGGWRREKKEVKIGGMKKIIESRELSIVTWLL